MAKSPFQTIRLRPLTGPVNPIASADELPLGVYSWKEEMEVTAANRLGRRLGFEDFSDSAGRPYYPTYLKEVTTNDGIPRLLAGTPSGDILATSSTSTSWSVVGSGFTSYAQWSVDALNNIAVASDGVGRLQSANLTSGTFSEISDLNGGDDIEGAKIVIQFSGCMFLLNFVEDGSRYVSRVRWSGLNDATSWATGGASIAGSQDLPYNQKILAAGVLGDRLIIYTDKSIWACRATGTATTFGFNQLYTDPLSGSKCISFAASLVTVGSNHVYVGRDGIYTFNQYQREPLRLEWLDAAARVLFEGDGQYRVDLTSCNLTAGFNQTSTKQELLISWEDIIGGRYTLFADTQAKTCDFSNRGWAAFCTHTRSSGASFGSLLDEFVPDTAVEWVESDAYNALCGLTLQDFCNDCSNSAVFLGSSKEDGDIKVIGSRADGSSIFGHTISGVTEGFQSIIRGVVPAGNEDHDKILRRLSVDVLTKATSFSPVRVRLRTGVSQQAHIPGDEWTSANGVQWRQHSDKLIGPDPSVSLDQLSVTAHQRSVPVEWNLFDRGKFIYWELSIVGPNNDEVIAGTLVDFTRIDMEVRVVPKK